VTNAGFRSVSRAAGRPVCLSTAPVLLRKKPTVAYDADVEQDGQSGEFAASANGTILESPKWVKAASTEKKEAGKEDKD